MNTRHINTCPVLSAALAAGIFLAAAPMQAQAPALSNTQKLQVKIAEQQAQVDALQVQVNALQAQIKKLQAQVRASSPSGVISPFYKVPNVQIPNYKIEPFQNPNFFLNPGNQSFGGQGFGGQGQQPLTVVPQPYSNILPCSIIFISQKTR